MRFDGKKWRKSRTVVTLQELDGVNIQFGKICKMNEPGAVKTYWTEKMYGGPRMYVYAKKIEAKGYSLTNMMYGKDFVRDGEVRVKAYLALGGSVYTTSWVHEEKTAEYQQKKIQKRLDNA